MEGNLLGLHSSFQHIDFVPTEDDWDVLTNSNDVTVPIWNILVRGPGSDIKHDDGTIALDTEKAPNKITIQGGSRHTNIRHAVLRTFLVQQCPKH